MHAFDQAIQTCDFSIVLQYDHIPTFPSMFTFSEEPLLHQHVGTDPEITFRSESPVVSVISMKLVVSAIALQFISY